MKYSEKKISSDTKFTGKVFTITEDVIEASDNNQYKREVVHHSGGAAVLAVNPKDEIALVRQFRYAQDSELLELPAGKVNPGENPLHTAARELEEETGHTAEGLSLLSRFIPCCAYSTEIIHIYKAEGALTPTKQNLDEGEFLDVLWMPLEQAVNKVLSGEINDGKTAFAILKYNAEKGLLD